MATEDTGASMYPAEREYVLRTGDAELARLGLQHRLWCEWAYAGWERARFGPGQRLLDVGCGPGYAAFDLAQLVGPSGSVVGVDVSQRFVSYLTREIETRRIANLTAHEGEVDNGLASRVEGPFDGAYARWVLCFVADPGQAVRDVAELLAPGGRFVIQDYYAYRTLALVPFSDAMNRTARAVEQSWRDGKGDPNIMQRVPQMLTSAGFVIESARPMVRTARPHEPLWQWPETFFANFLGVLVEGGYLTDDEADAFRADWARCAGHPAGMFITPPMLEIVAVRQ